MEEEIAALRKAVEQMRVEVEELAAESLAIQYIFVMMASNIRKRFPNVQPIILKVLDDATNFAEDMSIERGPRAAHFPETVRIIERFRTALGGKDKPRHGV